MKEYLKMSDVFPDGVYVGTEEWMNGWFEVRHVGGASIDESCDGGYSGIKPLFLCVEHCQF